MRDVLGVADVSRLGIILAVTVVVTQRLHVHLCALFNHDLVVIIHDLGVFGQVGTNALEGVVACVGAIFTRQPTFEWLIWLIVWRKCAHDVLVALPRRLPTMASTRRAQAFLFASMLSCVSAKTGWELGLETRPAAGKI
jgi:hypothetical protein